MVAGVRAVDIEVIWSGNSIASLDVVVDPSANTWPVEVSSDAFERLGLSEVSTKERFVSVAKNVEFAGVELSLGM